MRARPFLYVGEGSGRAGEAVRREFLPCGRRELFLGMEGGAFFGMQLEVGRLLSGMAA